MADTHHAATDALLRDGAGGLETLMLRKNSRLAFAGMWVSPGGRGSSSLPRSRWRW